MSVQLPAPTRQYKYQTTLEILLDAPLDASPADLAAEVRRRHPEGSYQAYRICEDINHILAGTGPFKQLAEELATPQWVHIAELKDSMVRRGIWAPGRRQG